MTTYERRPIKAHNPWLKRSYQSRGQVIAGVTIHITASGEPDGDDGPRTEGWWNNPQNDKGGWGSFADALIYEDGTQVECTDIDHEFAAWTAGYGTDQRTWALGILFIQLELAKGTIAEPWRPEQIDSAAQWVAEWSRKYDFPLERVEYEDQLGPPIRGINTHAGSANGRAYGKADPGENFPWDEFLAKARRYRAEMEGKGMSRLDDLIAVVLGNGYDAVCRPGTEDLFPEGTEAVPYGKDGPTHRLTGDAALAYARRTGQSLFLGLQHTQRALNEHVAGESSASDDTVQDLARRIDAHLEGHVPDWIIDHRHETGGPIADYEEE